MQFRFDDNDDLVIDDIPDDLIDLTRELAAECAVPVEDIWRDVVMRLVTTVDEKSDGTGKF